MIKLLPSQYKVINSKVRNICACSGRGGGKTFSGAVWSLINACKYPTCNGLICGANPTALNSIALLQFTRLLDNEGIRWVKGSDPPWYKSPLTSHVNVLSLENGSQIYLRSFHEAGSDANLRGLEVGWAWMDEARELQEEVFNVATACLRQKEGPNQILLSTTPSGHDWIYNKFAGPDKLSNSEIIRWTTQENKHLPPEFAKELEAQYSKEFYEQEVLGLFVDINCGTTVYQFGNKNIQPCEQWPGIPILFALDLNVAPLSGVVMQVDKQSNRVQILDEVVIQNGGQTSIACVEFLHRWHSKLNDGLLYLCDESGAARSTRTPETDVTIMKTELSRIDNSRCLNPFTKPRVIDRVNRVNGLLSPADNIPKLIIDPKCKKSIDDLRFCRWTITEPRQIDKSDMKLTHLTDAAGYGIVALLGLRSGSVVSSTNLHPAPEGRPFIFPN
jgi:hypothetical protein